MTPFETLLPYQRAWIADDSRFKIGLWSRQVGKSHATAGEAVFDCIRHPGAFWVILSAGERQALEWMLKAAAWTRAVAATLRGTVNADAARSTVSAGEIRFANGSRILAIPANPDTARGYSANLILDEFALHEHDREVWAAIYPSITNEIRGLKKVRIVSTPKGRGNKFAELWEEGGETWSRHKVTLQDAIEAGLHVDAAALRDGVADEDIWRQEYFCEFIANDTVYFPLDLIRSCERGEVADPGGEAPLFVGVDIGRSHDLTVIATAAATGSSFRFIDVETLDRLPFAEQGAILAERLKNPRVRACAIDATGIGAQLAEEARTRFGSRVEPIQFSNPVKTNLFQTLKRAMEEGRVEIPADRDLREDIHAIHRKISTGGNIQFTAPRRPDGHSDRATALALAVEIGTRFAGRGPIIMPEVIVRPADFRRKRIF